MIGKEKAKKLDEEVRFNFYYTFIDELGNRSNMQIIDWEIYQLHRKLKRKYGRKKALIRNKLKEKYYDEFVGNKEIYFYLGTNKTWHIRRSKNPFMIIGVFYPPKIIS